MPNPKIVNTLIIAIITVMVMIGLFCSCNAVNQVLKDPQKKEVVGREWAKVNPCVNDSVLVFQPGDTIVSVEYIEDTLFYYLNDTIRLPYGINKYTTVTKVVHDSIKVVVRDRRAERILEDSVQHYFGKMKMYKACGEDAKAIAAAAKKRATKWKWFFFLLIASALAYKFRIKLLGLVRHLIPVPIP